MNLRALRPLILITSSVFLASQMAAPAQGMGGNPSQAVSRVLAKLFGAGASFTTDADVEIQGTQTATLEMSLAFHQGKSRTDVDLSKMKMPSMPPGAVEQMKAMGMDRVISLSDDKTFVTTIIFPGMKGYVSMTNAPAAKDGAEPKITEAADGKESIDGREHIKQKVTITDVGGKTTDVVVWRPAAGEFPTQVEFNDSGTKAKMKFKNVVKKTPADSLFVISKDFEKFDSPQAMMMKRMMEKSGQ